MANKVTISLLLITLLGLVLRLYHLATIPNGFFFDESTIAYQAYSLIKTVHDTWGNFLPIFSFKDYGEYILPLGIYSQALFVILGGLTVFASRLPHALLGTTTVLFVFFLGETMFNRKIGLIAALFLAFSPLSLSWSRFVFEGNLGTAFLLLGIIFFVKSLKVSKFFPVPVLFFGFSMLTYHIFLVLTPILFLTFLIISKSYLKLNKRTLVLSLLSVLLFILWAAGSIYSGAGQQRFKQASTLITTQKLDILNHQIGYCRRLVSPAICKTVLNKPILIASSYLENYFGHFSPVYLGFDGTFLRQNILPRSGILLPLEMICFFAGLLFLFRSFSIQNKLLLAIVAVYPLANSFTGTGEISRIAFAAPYLCLVAAVGLRKLSALNRHFSIAISVAFSFIILSFLLNYFAVFPTTNAVYVDYGYDKVFSWLKDHHQKYNQIYISKNYSSSVPYISAMFFLPVDPKAFQEPGRVDRQQDASSYFVISRIDNYYFYSKLDWTRVHSHDFVVATPEELPRGKINPNFEIIDPTGRKLLIGVEGGQVINEKI